jgi:protein phosphatase 2C family protein 2/3
MTANPEVTLHDITEEDEFLVLASDGTLHSITLCPFFSSHPDEGIWECLSSQQVVDFVRLKVSEGKELREIGEILCDHCLAPDSNPPAHEYHCDCNRCFGDGYINLEETGIGCDNMTALIVAILQGRTKEEWYTWVTDRVKQKYGYETPIYLSSLYEYGRLMSFKGQRERLEKRDPRAVGAGMRQSGSYQVLVMANE